MPKVANNLKNIGAKKNLCAAKIEDELSSGDVFCQNIFRLKNKNALDVPHEVKFPQNGAVPDEIIKACEFGPLGKILDKETGEIVHPQAILRHDGDYDILALYTKGENIGHLSFKMLEPKSDYLDGVSDYIGESGALYIEFMKNVMPSRYAHTGSMLHRLVHLISKERGSEGKVVLKSAKSAASFHYDTGFRPVLNTDSGTFRYDAIVNKAELEIANGKNSSAYNMYLPVENMEKLEMGEHCTPKRFLNLSEDEYNRLSLEFTEAIKANWAKDVL